MATFTTEVEIDMDEIDATDLINEVVRMCNPDSFNAFEPKEIEILKAGLANKITLPISKSVEDLMKEELIKELWHKYTFTEFERRLKS